MNKTIFILGAPRSGTSLLLYMLVRNQPHVSGSDLESKFYAIANKLPYQPETFLNDVYFKSILSGNEINNIYKKSTNAIGFFRNVIKYKTDQVGANCFVEKSPIHTLYYKQIVNDFDNVSFILIYRNPAANIHSIATTKWIDLPCDKFPFQLKKNKSIRYFFSIMHYYKYWFICKEVEKKKETVLVLNYENIILEKAEIKEQLEFATGVKLSPLFIARPFSSEVTHKNTGFDKSRVDDYKQKMSIGTQKIIQLIFEPLSAKDYIVRFFILNLWLKPSRHIARIINR